MDEGVSRLPSGARVYLMGICGTGMTALAGLLKAKGFVVTGSDVAFYAPMGELLKKLKIPVYKGYNPGNLIDAAPDLVIIGNVIRASNPEAKYVMEQGLEFMSFPQALGEFFLSDRYCLVIAGTHGKTTTSTMAVSALKGCGFRPGFLIGGIVSETGRGFEQGLPPWFVIEGDEYDTAFFDKVSKFLHYRPKSAVITSMEYDHADIFPDFNAIKTSFMKFVRLLPQDGILTACTDWKAVKEVAEKATCKVITYGLNGYADWSVEDIQPSLTHTSYVAVHKTGLRLPVSIQLPGRHNVLNSLSVLALCDGLGLDIEKAAVGLGRCKGAKRRQEIVGQIQGIIVIDDFAHHPRAVSETLQALKERYGSRRLIAVFEPRTNTSRRAVFQDAYARAFFAADKVMVRQVPEPEKAPEGDRFSSKQLVQDLKNQGLHAQLYEDAGEIIKAILDDLRQEDVYVILSNGPFEGIHSRLLKELKKTLEPAP